MEVELIKSVFIYYINNRNKVIGKLENISKKEKLKNIRPLIKKMNKNDEFVKPLNGNDFDIFDKEMEEDFSFDDILIKENGLYKIYIKESSDNLINKDINKNINNMNNNINNFNNNKSNNGNKNMNNMNNNINNLNNMNNLNNINNMNRVNIIKNNINNNINPFNNNMINNNMNNNMNMNNINPFNNNKFNNMVNMNNNISNLNNMNFNMNNMNMNNINPFNNNIFNNMVNMNNNISNLNNMNFNINNNMNNMINNNNINSQNNMNNNNNLNCNLNFQNVNNLNNNLNNQTNDYFMVKYNINFKTSNGIKYSLIVNGRTKMINLLKTFEKKMGVNTHLHYIYNGKIRFNPSLYIFDSFKGEKNPTILVEDKYKLIGKLINVSFKMKNGDEYLITFNSKSKIDVIKHGFFDELSLNNYDDYNQIKFSYNNHYSNFNDINIIWNIEDFFNYDDNPKIFIDDPKNLIGKKLKVTFKINNAYNKEIITHSKKTIGNLLRIFLNEIDEDFNIYSTILFSPYDKWTFIKKFVMQIVFLYKGNEIIWLNDDMENKKIFYNATFIEDYFKSDNNPVIYVMDKRNCLSPINVTFKTTYGHLFNFIISSIKTIDNLLMKYVFEMEHSELVDTNKIGFLYYNKQINFGDNTILYELFLNEKNPLILVVDGNFILNNNLLQKKNIIFQMTNGRTDTIIVNYGTTVEQAIKIYLYKIAEEESIDSYYSKNKSPIYKYLFNGSNLIGEKRNVEEFSFSPSPINITVIEH